MGEMKIELLPDAKPIKKRPYKLAQKYKNIVKNEIDNMLKVGIIYLVDESEWASLMVVQPKKHDPKRIKVCVDFRWIDKVTLSKPFPTSFVDEIINEVAGHECYSFMVQPSSHSKRRPTQDYFCL